MNLRIFALVMGITTTLLFPGVTLASSCKDMSAKGTISVCFVPGENCVQFIVEAIQRATKTLHIQAFNYTEPRILESIALAKSRRGVNIGLILDEDNEQARYGAFIEMMMKHGIVPLVDSKVAIAHNKIIVIDGMDVIGGSFNYTASAQNRNAENVTLVRNNPEFARCYIDNWEKRAAVSRPYKMPPPEDIAQAREKMKKRKPSP